MPVAKKTAAPVTPAAPARASAKPKAKEVKETKVEVPVEKETPQPVVDSVDKTGDTILSSLVEKVNVLTSQLKEVQNLIKLLGKEYDKQQKIIDKVQKKRQNAKNSPSGFAKPNKISNQLCDFIGVPYGTEKSRTDITRFINKYVKDHNLNNPVNRRFIKPDASLQAILNVDKDTEVNYFILQKLISHHFPPSASKQKAA